MSLEFAAISPHPPIIVPEVGGEETKKCQKTISAMEQLADKLCEARPQTVIVISPHALIHPDKFAVYASPKFYGDFGQFGAPNVSFHFNNDLILSSEIVKKSNENNIKAFSFGNPESEYFELDHGVMVPLYYLAKKIPKDTKILPIAFSLLGKIEHFTFGQVIKEVVNSPEFSDNKIAVVASGDLSHRLFQGAPAGYSPEGKEFDQELVELIRKNKVREILEMDDEFIEAAGECGYRSILILLGALDGLNYKPEILSYEGPFGVGYLVADFINLSI